MNVEFVPLARDEFLSAISHYEECHPGLGEQFKREVENGILWISGNAELYPVRAKGYRRFNLKTFPYNLPFVVRKETLWILAVAHCARKPEYWITREL